MTGRIEPTGPRVRQRSYRLRSSHELGRERRRACVSSVRRCAAVMEVPFSEVSVDQFEDPYQVPRVLQTLLEAPVPSGGPARSRWLEKVMATPLLAKPAS